MPAQLAGGMVLLQFLMGPKQTGVQQLASLSSGERSSQETGKESGVSGVLDAVGRLEGAVI